MIRNIIYLQYLKLKLLYKGYIVYTSYNYDICLSHNSLTEIPDILLDVPFSIDFSYNKIKKIKKGFINNKKVCFSMNEIEDIGNFKFNVQKIYFQCNCIKRIPKGSGLEQCFDFKTIFFDNPILDCIEVRDENLHDIDLYKQKNLFYYKIEDNDLSRSL